MAGELGLIYLTPEKTFEELVGSKSIAKLTKEKFGKPLYISDLIQLHNKESDKLLNKIMPYFGQAIGNIINIFSPEAIVLAGGFKDPKNKFIKLIKKESEKYVLTSKNCELIWSKLKEPGVLGASLLID